tara:strand:- start:104 stop:292 length:189 start_codon:yes stop_codon:yes gene_type:complete
MARRKKYNIFSILMGKFDKEIPEDSDYAEYLDILEAERSIARRMIKQKLDKISAKMYDESKD